MKYRILLIGSLFLILLGNILSLSKNNFMATTSFGQLLKQQQQPKQDYSWAQSKAPATIDYSKARSVVQGGNVYTPSWTPNMPSTTTAISSPAYQQDYSWAQSKAPSSSGGGGISGGERSASGQTAPSAPGAGVGQMWDDSGGNTYVWTGGGWQLVRTKAENDAERASRGIGVAQAVAQPVQPQQFDASTLLKRLQQGVGNVGQAIGGAVGGAGNNLLSAIGRIVQPTAQATGIDYSKYMSPSDYSQYMSKAPVSPTPTTKTPFGYTGAGSPAEINLGPAIGRTVAGLGGILGELTGGEKRLTLGGLMPAGLGAYIAGQTQPFFGSPVQAAERVEPTIDYSQYRSMAPEDLFTDEDVVSNMSTGGGGYSFQTTELGDLLSYLMNTSLNAQPEQLATVDTSPIDSWVEMAKSTGLDDSQAALEGVSKQITVITDLLENLDKDIAEEAGNFLMTEAQRRRLVASRGKPLRDQLTKLVAGASKYGVAIKDALSMLDQQIKLKQIQSQERLAAQKAIEESQQNRIKNLTNLLPYLGATTGGQELTAQTQKDIAAMKNEEGLF